jgi:hypothetical protein
LKLVELFGYTLGGIYLARYKESPCGEFDEMVVLAGLVWNKNLSCAWAKAVFVNDLKAKKHGIRTCGLPSEFARFNFVGGSKTGHADLVQEEKKNWNNWNSNNSNNNNNNGNTEKKRELRSLAINPIVMRTTTTNKKEKPWWQSNENKKKKSNEKKVSSSSSTSSSSPSSSLIVDVSGKNKNNNKSSIVCEMKLPSEPKKIISPRIKMFLPSFSGRTKTCPELMKYSLEMNANVRLSQPITMIKDNKNDIIDTSSSSLNGILHGKPLICIAFDFMTMSVGRPEKCTM